MGAGIGCEIRESELKSNDSTRGIKSARNSKSSFKKMLY